MIFIDTQLWVFAQKPPNKKKFRNEETYNQLLQNHQISKTFIAQKVETEEISMTYHQLGEIFHSLAYRGDKISLKFCQKYCWQLLDSQFICWYPITQEHLKTCITLSTDSGIHIWDYICVVPLIKEIIEIYSCDAHFQHDSFQQFGKPIINPLNQWIPF